MSRLKLEEENDELMAFATPNEVFKKKPTASGQPSPIGSPVMPSYGQRFTPQQRPISQFPTGPRRYSPGPSGKKPFPDNFPGDFAPASSNLSDLHYDVKAKRNTMAVVSHQKSQNPSFAVDHHTSMYPLPTHLSPAPPLPNSFPAGHNMMPGRRLSAEYVVQSPHPASYQRSSSLTPDLATLPPQRLDSLDPRGSSRPASRPASRPHSQELSDIPPRKGGLTPKAFSQLVNFNSPMSQISADDLYTASPIQQVQETAPAPSMKIGQVRTNMVQKSTSHVKSMVALPSDDSQLAAPFEAMAIGQNSGISSPPGRNSYASGNPNQISPHSSPKNHTYGSPKAQYGSPIPTQHGSPKAAQYGSPKAQFGSPRQSPKLKNSSSFSQQQQQQQQQEYQSSSVAINSNDDPLEVEQKLRAIFQNCDNGSGNLNTLQLIKALSSADSMTATFGVQTSRVLVKAFDKSNKGSIDFKEFFHLFSYLTKWKNVFYAQTQESLTLAQYSAALENLGYRMSVKTINYMFTMFASEKYDMTGAGIKSLSIESFIENLTWLMKSTSSFKKFDNQRIGVGVFPFDNYVEEVLSFRF